MRHRFTSASCPTCNTLFERLPIDYNEDGSWLCPAGSRTLRRVLRQAAMPVLRSVRLRQLRRHLCVDHLVSVEDGTETPLHCCPTCASECEVLPLPFPPQSENSIASLTKRMVA